MVLKADKERIRTLLKDTITLLCKNGLSFKSKFSVEALIGVTLDEDDVFLVSINEIVKGDMVLSQLDKSDDDSDASDSTRSPQPYGKRRKRRKSKIKAERNFDGSGVDSEGVNSNDGGPDRPDNEAAAFPSDDNEPVSKRAHLQVKQETQDDVDDDIVFVKSELESNWSQNDSTWGQHTPGDTNNQTAMYSGEGNMDIFQEDPNLPSTSFSGMDLVPVSQDTSGDWNSPTMNPKQNYRSHGPRSSTITASSSQDNTGSITDPNSSQTEVMGGHGTQWNVYQCSRCEKSYSSCAGLQMHMATHTGNYPHTCSICGQGYTRKCLLEYHINKHLGVKGFSCHLCNQSFVQKCSLNRHLQKKHKSAD